MMSFGFTTLGDVLSWAIVLLLGSKAAATVILLSMRTCRAEPALWWTTKLTPVVAMPPILVLAARAHDREEVMIFTALAVFVAVAVPWKIRRRYAAQRRAG